MVGRIGKSGLAMAVFVGLTSASAFAGGGDTALEVCAACHGSNGISVAANIPNLAGQRAKYLEKQLQAFRAGERANAIMNAVAEQLDDTTITAIAAFFAGLPGAEGDEMSDLLPGVNETHVAFPEGYEDSFTYYMTINFPEKKQVRRYFANPVAVAAAKNDQAMPSGAYFFVEAYKAKLDPEGEPIEGADGQLEADGIAFYTAMARGDGWGEQFPEILRNGDWNYAVFSKDKERKAGVNQALCLACHKPLSADSYVFSMGNLQAELE